MAALAVSLVALAVSLAALAVSLAALVVSLAALQLAVPAVSPEASLVVLQQVVLAASLARALPLEELELSELMCPELAMGEGAHQTEQ